MQKRETQAASHLITDQPFLPALEGLRGLAAVALVMNHCYFILFGHHNYFNFSYLSVDFFFILSGFILIRRYEDAIASGRVSFRHFAIARFARLYPMYLVGLLLALMWPELNRSEMWMVVREPYSWQLFTQLAMLQNMLSRSGSFLGHEWSTSVEWIVNIGFFLAVWYFRRIPVLCIWAVLVANIAYMTSHTLELHLYLPERYFYNCTLARGSAGFCIGYLLFRYHHRLPRLGLPALHALEMLLAALLLLACIRHDAYFWSGIGYFYLLVLFPGLLTLCLYRDAWANRFFSLGVMTWIGKVSYSLYILHRDKEPLYLELLHDMGVSLERPLLGIGYLLFVLMLSAVTYQLIEKPCRKLGKYYIQTKAC